MQFSAVTAFTSSIFLSPDHQNLPNQRQPILMSAIRLIDMTAIWLFPLIRR